MMDKLTGFNRIDLTPKYPIDLIDEKNYHMRIEPDVFDYVMDRNNWHKLNDEGTIMELHEELDLDITFRIICDKRTFFDRSLITISYSVYISGSPERAISSQNLDDCFKFVRNYLMIAIFKKLTSQQNILI